MPIKYTRQVSLIPWRIKETYLWRIKETGRVYLIGILFIHTYIHIYIYIYIYFCPAHCQSKIKKKQEKNLRKLRVIHRDECDISTLKKKPSLHQWLQQSYFDWLNINDTHWHNTSQIYEYVHVFSNFIHSRLYSSKCVRGTYLLHRWDISKALYETLFPNPDTMFLTLTTKLNTVVYCLKPFLHVITWDVS
jgi:hypothetical protein